MDKVIELLQSLMQQAASLADELSEEEMANVLKIFQTILIVMWCFRQYRKILL